MEKILKIYYIFCFEYQNSFKQSFTFFVGPRDSTFGMNVKIILEYNMNDSVSLQTPLTFPPASLEYQKLSRIPLPKSFSW